MKSFLILFFIINSFLFCKLKAERMDSIICAPLNQYPPQYYWEPEPYKEPEYWPKNILHDYPKTFVDSSNGDKFEIKVDSVILILDTVQIGEVWYLKYSDSIEIWGSLLFLTPAISDTVVYGEVGDFNFKEMSDKIDSLFKLMNRLFGY